MYGKAAHHMQLALSCIKPRTQKGLSALLVAEGKDISPADPDHVL